MAMQFHGHQQSYDGLAQDNSLNKEASKMDVTLSRLAAIHSQLSDHCARTERIAIQLFGNNSIGQKPTSAPAPSPVPNGVSDWLSGIEATVTSINNNLSLIDG